MKQYIHWKEFKNNCFGKLTNKRKKAVKRIFKPGFALFPSMKLYLDSNVLISFLRSEIDRAFNLRFTQTEDFLLLCKSLKIEIVISEFVIFEVKKIIFLEKKDIIEFFEFLEIKEEYANAVPVEKALEISKKIKVHLTDAIHIATAIESNCNSIITWNKKDFEKASTMIKNYTPLEFFEKNS